MILEIADFAILPGAEAEFTNAYRTAVGFIAAAPGARSVRMTRGVESPSRFVLLVEWDDVGAHEAFRASSDFARWRAPIAGYFDGSPHMEHFADL